MKIGVLPGDDIGYEVVPETVKVLTAAAARTGLDVEWITLPIGKEGHEKHGDTTPDITIAGLKETDGWIMGPFGSPEDFQKGWQIAADGARAAGKNPDDLTAGRLLYVAVDDDRAKARADLTRFLHGYYGPGFDVEKHGIFGPPGEVTARLREQVDAGITHLMLGVPNLDRLHLRRLAEEVAPALR